MTNFSGYCLKPFKKDNINFLMVCSKEDDLKRLEEIKNNFCLNMTLEDYAKEIISNYNEGFFSINIEDYDKIHYQYKAIWCDTRFKEVLNFLKRKLPEERIIMC